METSLREMIKAERVSKYFGPFVAIEDVSFSIPEGQIVAFLGPNGAGKSTTMKILTGYLAPSKGSTSIAGLDMQSERVEAAKMLGYLPENGPLYLDMTPLEVLKFFGKARGLENAHLTKRIEWVCEQYSLFSVLEKPIGKLSRGYRQRVGLAQALLHDPDVLIMDEPTAGLDPNQIRDFRDSLWELRKTKTILISTHILQEVDAVADRVLFIHDGKLIFDGTPGDLKQEGSLEEPFHRMTEYGESIPQEVQSKKGPIKLGFTPTLVLADDNPAVRQLIQLSFAGENFVVHCCEDGESTLNLLENQSVDILLVDARLPGLDGYELCRRVKQNSDTAHILVVLLGSVLKPLDTSRKDAVQCDGSLTKPLVTSQLVELVKQLLLRKSHDRSSQN